MGLFDSFKNSISGFFGSSRPRMSPDQLSESRINLASDSPIEDFYRTPIIRDTGLKSKTVQEALEVLTEAAPTLPGLSLFMDKYGFRSLTQNMRDLNDSVRTSLLRRAETLSTTNGLAQRALQIRTDLIVSEGFKVDADPDKDCPPEIRQRIQDVLDEHWEINDWQERSHDRVMDLQRTGELIRRVPALSKKIGGSRSFKLGKFTCGNILPHLVYGVSIDPWNYEKLDRMYLEQYAFPNSSIEDLTLKIISDERLSAQEFGSIRGDVLYLCVNRRPGCSRGYTDLAPAIDWIDIYEQILMMDCHRAQMMMRFIWDVTIEGATPETIKNYAEQIRPGGPAPAAVRIHSEKERWDAISPDLRLMETKELREDIFILAWGAMGLPRPWYSDGDNSNRATIENMTDPNFAWARTRRRSFTSHLALEHRYALQVAYDSGRFLDIPIDRVPHWLKLKVVSRDPDRKGYESVGAVWSDMANALTVLISQEMIDKQSAADIIRTVIGTYGFEIDPERMKIKNSYDLEQDKPIEDDPQQSQIDSGVDPSTGQSISSQADPSQKISESNRRRLSVRHRGILGSSNPFDAILNEANEALSESKKSNRKLKRMF